MKVIPKKIIYGCEARGDADSAYLTRYTLLSLFGYHLYLHVFHRSDADDLHDHPWDFWTLVLWGGYIEHVRHVRYDIGARYQWHTKRRVYPGTFLFRRARHAHRVELVEGKKAITLVLVSYRKRDWGFFVGNKWVQWQKYFQQKGC